MRGEYKIKTKMLRRAAVVLAMFAVATIVGVVVALANTEEKTFSTEELGETTLEVSEGQEQVRGKRLEEMQEVRRIAEEKAEEERRLQEAKDKEKRRIAREKEKRRLAEKKQKAKEVKTATTEKKRDTGKSGRDLGKFEATAYGPDCVGCSGITANGTDIRNGNIYSNGYRVIAADTRVIPMNSIVKITYSSGKTELAIVADVGGKIKGRIIDIAFASEAETPAFGRQQVNLELIK